MTNQKIRILQYKNVILLIKFLKYSGINNNGYNLTE